MATTTNFGWETPDDTDLVKDGALAIRTLGNSIDTSLVDLKGGTTGQVLSKTSNTDMDFTWINNDQGDITAVTAGTGLTGGGTTGAVTLTNDMATTITASGDIVVGTGSGTYDNLPIGTTGQVLTADTTVSPYKVKWATPSSTTLPTFSAYADSDQSQTANVWTKKTFAVEEWDTANNFASSRFTPTTAGYYQVSTGIYANDTGTIDIAFYKNGSEWKGIARGSSSTNFRVQITALVYLNGSTDYVEVYSKSSSGTIYSGSASVWFQGIGVRS